MRCDRNIQILICESYVKKQTTILLLSKPFSSPILPTSPDFPFFTYQLHKHTEKRKKINYYLRFLFCSSATRTNDLQNQWMKQRCPCYYVTWVKLRISYQHVALPKTFVMTVVIFFFLSFVSYYILDLPKISKFTLLHYSVNKYMCLCRFYQNGK